MAFARAFGVAATFARFGCVCIAERNRVVCFFQRIEHPRIGQKIADKRFIDKRFIDKRCVTKEIVDYRVARG